MAALGRLVIEVAADLKELVKGGNLTNQQISKIENNLSKLEGNVNKTSNRAAASIDGQLNRAIAKTQAELQLVQKGWQGATQETVEYISALSKTKGVDIGDFGKQTTELKSLQDQLFQAKSKTDGLGISQKQLGFAMRNVPAQISDIVISLQGGQRPLTVFLQQGAQLKDLFGGVGLAARSLAGYVLGLITPMNVAIAASIGFAAALYKGYSESQRIERALIASGNAAGTTTGQMNVLASEVGDVSTSYGVARDAAELLSKSGVASGEQLKTVMYGVVSGVQVTGESVQELVDDFADIAKDPVDAIVELNEKYNFLTLSVYKQISSLQDQGREQEAVTLAMETYANVMQNRSVDVERNLGAIERSWLAVKNVARSAIDDLLSLGRDLSLEEQLSAEQGKLSDLFKIKNRVTGARFGSDDEVREQVALVNQLYAKVNGAKEKALVEGEEAAAVKAAIAGDKAYNDYINNSSRLTRSDQLSQKLEEENRAFAEATKTFEKNSEEYRNALRAHEVAVDNIRASFNKKSNAIASKAARERDQRLREVQRLFLAEDKFAADIAQTRFAREQHNIETLAELQSDLRNEFWKNDRKNQDIAQKEYLKRLRDYEREQERVSNTLTRIITDGIYRGFENGKSFAENFWQTLKNSAKTLVLQPLVRMVVDSSGLSKAVNSFGGLFSGGANSSSTSGSVWNGISNNLSNLSSAFTNGSGSLTNAIQSFGAFISNGQGGVLDTVGGWLGSSAGAISAYTPYIGAAIQALSGDVKGAAFTAAGAAIGSIIPGIGTAIGALIGSVVGSFVGGGTPKRNWAQVNGTTTDGEFKSRVAVAERDGPAAIPGLRAVSQGFSSVLTQFLENFGADANFKTYAAFSTRPDKDTKAGFSGSINGKSFGVGAAGLRYEDDDRNAFKKFSDYVLGPALSQAIKRSALSDGIKKFFKGVSKKKDVLETMDALTSLTAALEDLPPVFNAIKNAIDTTDYNLGVDGLKSLMEGTQRYTGLFYSEQENFETFTKQLSRQFAALNIAIPSARDQFRALVDGINVIDAATAVQYQALIALAPVVDEYYSFLERSSAQQDSINRSRADGLSKGFYSSYADYVSAQANVAANGDATLFLAQRRTEAEINRALLAEQKIMRTDFAELKTYIGVISKVMRDTKKIYEGWEKLGLPETRNLEGV